MKLQHLTRTFTWFAMLLATRSAVASDLLPDRWVENVAATDGSVQQSLVFRTVAGVNYRVESSGDLTTWVQEEVMYGMGHELVIPMRQFTPPLHQSPEVRL
jgi:hypothetical protein